MALSIDKNWQVPPKQLLLCLSSGTSKEATVSTSAAALRCRVDCRANQLSLKQTIMALAPLKCYETGAAIKPRIILPNNLYEQLRPIDHCICRHNHRAEEVGADYTQRIVNKAL